MLLLVICLFLFYGLLTALDFSTDYSCKSYTYIGPRQINLMASNCSEVFGHVWILRNDTSYEEMVRVFSTVRVIHGCVQIRNTFFVNLSFFEKLEEIDCSNNEIQAVPINDSLSIVDNPYLTTLGLQSLRRINGPQSGYNLVRPNHRFCLHDWELELLTGAPGDYRVCEENELCYEPPLDEMDVNNIPHNCTMLFRNITLTEGNVEIYLERLQPVQTLVGSLTVVDSNITSIRLPNLEHIVSSDNGYEPAITLDCNFALQEVTFHPNFTVIGGCTVPSVDYSCIKIYAICGTAGAVFSPNVDQISSKQVCARAIYGCVQIRNTNYPNLSFFRNVENITCTQNEIQAYPLNESFAVINNPNLQFLGMKKIKFINGSVGMNSTLMKPGQDFCLETHEMGLIWAHPDEFYGCGDHDSCRVKPAGVDNDYSLLSENCTMIKWSLMVTDKQYLKRLKNVVIIYGILTIANLDVKRIDLPNLRKIVTHTLTLWDSVYPYPALVLVCNNDLWEVNLHPLFTIEGQCIIRTDMFGYCVQQFDNRNVSQYKQDRTIIFDAASDIRFSPDLWSWWHLGGYYNSFKIFAAEHRQPSTDGWDKVLNYVPSPKCTYYTTRNPYYDPYPVTVPYGHDNNVN